MKYLQGYTKSLNGDNLGYHSIQPEVRSALVVRSLHEKYFIEWQTESVPINAEEDMLQFCWLFAINAGCGENKFRLFINDDEYLQFSAAKNHKVESWTVFGKDGSKLSFKPTIIDRYEDLMGYAFLRVPASSFDKGKPLTLKVVGESAYSRVWYMTFEGAVTPKPTITAQPALIRDQGRLRQPIAINLVHIGDPVKATFTAEGAITVEADLKFGQNSLTMLIPESSAERVVAITALIGNKKSKHLCKVKPVKKWTTYLVQHTHTDIGYTRPQTEILPEHLRYIDYALDYCDLTDNYPEEAQFRWTCEVSWPVREYLRSRPPEQISRLKRRIAEGRIEVTGMFLNMSEVMDEAGFKSYLEPVAEIRSHGLPVQTAMQNDINGIAWCLVDYFANIGIRYLTMGEHNHKALIPFDYPTVFRWQSPSGKEVIAYRPDHYNTGNFWGIQTGNMNTVEPELFTYLRDLEEKGYPYDQVAVQYSGYFIDNSPPSLIGSKFVVEWNKKFEWPKLRTAIASDFLSLVESYHGNNLPIHRQSWPDWWTDGCGSAPREWGAVRTTQGEFNSTQGLMALGRLLGAEMPKDYPEKVKRISDNLSFYAEHTYGSHDSISNPFNENDMIQWGEKSSYAWDGVKETRLLQEMVMGRIQSYFSKSDVPTIVIVNPTGSSRTGIHHLYIDHEVLPIHNSFKVLDAQSSEILMQPVRSRPEGTYWALYCKEVPAFGFTTYRLEIEDAEGEPLVVELDKTPIYENEFYRLTLHPSRGAISSLVDKQNGIELIDADADWLLGEFIYEELGNRRQLELLKLDDVERSGLKNVRFKSIKKGAIWTSIFLIGESAGCKGENGVKIEIRIFNLSKRLEFHYTIHKTPIISPESVYVAFPFKLAGGQPYYEAQGGFVRPGIDQLNGTSSDWYPIQNFAAIRSKESQIILTSPQTPLMMFGDINLGRFDYNGKPQSNQIYSWVMNNLWTTNFRAVIEGELSWHYTLTSTSDTSNTLASELGSSERIPLLSRVLPSGTKSSELVIKSLFNLVAKGVAVISMTPARAENGIVLQLRELEGVEEKVEISAIPKGRKIIAIDEIDLFEGNPISLNETFTLKAFEVKFIRLTLG